METRPVYSTVVSLQNILDDNIVGSEELGLYVHCSRCGGISAGHWIHHSFSHLLLAKASGIPDTDGLIQTRRYDKVLRRVEGSTHDVVIVSSQNTKTRSLVEVPQSESLIIRRTQNPWELRRIRMELNRSDVVQVTQKSEKTSPQFVVPNLNLVVVTARNNQRLVRMKVNSTYWAFVLFKAINYSSYTVVPSIVYISRVRRGYNSIILVMNPTTSPRLITLKARQREVESK